MIALLNLAQSGAVLAAVKTEPPPTVALPLVGPVLTAAARGAPLNPGRDGETVLRSNKETGTLSTPDQPSGPIANRDVTIDHRR